MNERRMTRACRAGVHTSCAGAVPRPYLVWRACTCQCHRRPRFRQPAPGAVSPWTAGAGGGGQPPSTAASLEADVEWLPLSTPWPLESAPGSPEDRFFKW